MNKPTLSLAALLMLGGATIATAQEGPGDRMPSPAQGLERVPSADTPGGDTPRGSRGEGADGPSERLRDEGPRAEGPDPDERKGPPKPDPSDATRKDDASPDRPKARDGDRGRSEKSASDKDDAKGADRKARTETRDKADGKADDSKTGRDAQAKPERSKQDERKDDAAETEKARPDRDKAADRERPGEDGKQGPGDRKQAEGDRRPPEEARKVDLSGDKRERVGSAFRERRDVKRRTDVDIDISVGTRLPSDWEFVPVPTTVVEVVPEYRGYVFAYVEDEYVICDPVTYEVVAVLPAEDGPRYAGGGGGSSAAADDRCSKTLTLSEDERDFILRSIQMTDEADVSDITVGWSVPGEIELKTFPEPVIDRTGKLASCRYFVAEDQIAIVDPAEETVVLLIEQD